MSGDTLYNEQIPGNLITVEIWHELQRKIKADIQGQITAAKDEIKKAGVDKAGNADKLENKTKAQLTDEILKLAEALAAKRTDYRSYFRWINNEKEPVVIEHGLLNFPVVDVYELDPIDVICSEDEELSSAKVLFYLHHTSEMSLSKKVPTVADPDKTTLVKMTLDANFDIPFSEMLKHYGITPSEDATLDSLESDFWDAFFEKNGEKFDDRADESTCHSPWFDRCCGDHRTVSQLKKAGDWDKLMFQVKPRKTVNLQEERNPASIPVNLVPANVEVTQLGFNRIGIRLTTAQGAQPEGLAVLVILNV